MWRERKEPVDRSLSTVIKYSGSDCAFLSSCWNMSNFRPEKKPSKACPQGCAMFLKHPKVVEWVREVTLLSVLAQQRSSFSVYWREDYKKTRGGNKGVPQYIYRYHIAVGVRSRLEKLGAQRGLRKFVARIRWHTGKVRFQLSSM